MKISLAWAIAKLVARHDPLIHFKLRAVQLRRFGDKLFQLCNASFECEEIQGRCSV